MDFLGARWTKKETIIILLVIAVILCGIIYNYRHSPINVLLSFIAALVAAIAAFAATISLKYTRDTIRPFLSFDGTIKLGGSKEEKTLAFLITNSGSMPADNVEVRIDTFGTSEVIGLENLSKIYGNFFGAEENNQEQALALFPNQSWHSVFDANLTRDVDRELWDDLLGEKVKLRITIKYRSLGRKHKTIQTLSFDELSLSADGKSFHGNSIQPQKWI